MAMDQEKWRCGIMKRTSDPYISAEITDVKQVVVVVVHTRFNGYHHARSESEVATHLISIVHVHAQVVTNVVRAETSRQLHPNNNTE